VRFLCSRVGDEVELVGQGPGTEPPALRPLPVQEGIAERTQEVGEVVFAPEQARTGENTRVCLLDEVLGVLSRAAERPRGPVEPIEVVSQPGGVERMLGPAVGLRPVGGVDRSGPSELSGRNEAVLADRMSFAGGG
jgi:hypothetical protein